MYIYVQLYMQYILRLYGYILHMSILLMQKL